MSKARKRRLGDPVAAAAMEALSSEWSEEDDAPLRSLASHKHKKPSASAPPKKTTGHGRRSKKVLRRNPSPDDGADQQVRKPLLDAGARVYAAWWPDKKRRRKARYYRGVVASYRDVKREDDEYGPARFYGVHYDDGETINDVEDCFVFEEGEFLLSTRCSGVVGEDWIGVKRVVDLGSSDNWAKTVGWYTADIDGQVQTFSLLSEALRASDASIVKKKGPKNIKETDLNLPDEWSWLFIKESSAKSKAENGGHCVKKEEEPPALSPSPPPESSARRNLQNKQNKSIPKTSSSYGSLDVRSINGKEAESCDEPQRKKKKLSKDATVLVSAEKNERGKSDNATTLDAVFFPVKVEPSSPLAETVKSVKWGELQKAVPAPKSKLQHKKYMGVSYHKGNGKYVSGLSRGGKGYSLGVHFLAADGALAFDEAVRLHDGEGCCVNFVARKDYKDARMRELEETGLSSSTTGDLDSVVSAIKDRLSKLPFTAKKAGPEHGGHESKLSINNNEKEDNDVSSCSSDSLDFGDEIGTVASAAPKSDTKSSLGGVDRDRSAGVRFKNAYQYPKEAKLMQLTADQANDVSFPPGCPVLHHTDQTNTVVHAICGVVTSVFMDLMSREFVYEVKPAESDGSSTEGRVPERELAFGIDCPVYVSSGRQRQGTPLQGRILFSKTSSLSAVMIQKDRNQFQVMKAVPLDCIKYRRDTKTKEPITAHITASVHGNDVKGQSTQKAEAKKAAPPVLVPKMTTSPAKDKDVQTIAQQLHSSNSGMAAVGKATKKRPFTATVNPRQTIYVHGQPRPSLPEGNSMKSISSSIRSQISNRNRGPEHSGNDPQSSEKRPYSDSLGVDNRLATRKALVGTSTGEYYNHFCRVYFPQYLVYDTASIDRLHDYLSKGSGSRKNLRTIGNELYCIIKMSNHERSMHIYIEAKAGPFSLTAKERIKLAKEEVEHCLLEYIGHDGSSGRLFYDIAKSCTYLHPKGGARSTSVMQRNPFSPNKEMGWMNIVELPHLRGTGNQKHHHGHYLLTKTILGHIKHTTRCEVKLCGDQFNVPTKHCPPYVYVIGDHPGRLDTTVEILQDAIWSHMSECRCVL